MGYGPKPLIQMSLDLQKSKFGIFLPRLVIWTVFQIYFHKLKKGVIYYFKKHVVLKTFH